MKKLLLIFAFSFACLSITYSQPLWHLGEDSYVADDTTYIKMYRYSIASTYRDTLQELNVVYEAPYYRALPPFRVDTIIVPDAWEASERLALLTDYHSLSGEAKASILSYLNKNYKPMSKIIKVLSFELPPEELRSYFQAHFDFGRDNEQVLDSVAILAPKPFE